ncbi:hypothetical protein AC1031_022099 [Aphanomyces cochlioides]|nr:hypothetical protein AC1031_022099 [Aphanomyces cochlioides]
MLGSVDCYNWKWKNCPKAWHGQYRGNKGTSISLEAVVSHDLHFWSYNFGIPGSLNDINVVERSTLLHDIVNGAAPIIEYVVNGKTYKLPYWLVDGIYPQWAVFVKGISHPQSEARRWFTKQQEALRKDVERGFGVLHARFAIVKNPARSWSRERVSSIMKACVILHNMIVEDEQDSYELVLNTEFDIPSSPTSLQRVEEAPANVDQSINAVIQRLAGARDAEVHRQLQADLF